MNERKFRDSLVSDAKEVKAIVRLTGIPSGPSAAGLPDFIYRFYGGNFWIELKACELPKRVDTATRIGEMLTDLQRNNLEVGYAMNGMAAIFLGFEYGSAKFMVIVNPDDVNTPILLYPNLRNYHKKSWGEKWNFAKINDGLLEVVKRRWATQKNPTVSVTVGL